MSALSSSGWLLKVENLSKHFYLHEQARQIPSTFNISFTLHPGQLLAISGPSGAGKSSLLKCIWRSYLPTSGHIWLRQANGERTDIATASEQQMLALRHHELGFVTQFLHCLPRKSALDVVAAPLSNHGTPLDAAREQAARLLRQLNVPEHLWHLAPATFSGGEQQRINLARGLIRQPRVLLLDEPTASLDATSRQHAITLLREIKSRGTAMLAVFHDPALIDALADGCIAVHPASQPASELLAV